MSLSPIFSRKELTQIRFSVPYEQVDFWTLWIRKEAYLKCLGTGIDSNCSQVKVVDDTLVADSVNYKLATEVFDEFVISVCTSE
ncbi:MAG: 4'-phosphopantetheinyl transferase superfamily protein [Candidatus Ancillula trichonymphae]|nr:4'-phosphopantetheinyl transferase superfamily protein [Candidatus Ancillula trichonymphae]